MALGAVEVVVLQWRRSGALLLGSAAGKSGFVRHLPAVQGVRCERERERPRPVIVNTLHPVHQTREGGGGNGVKGRQPLIVMERETVLCARGQCVCMHACAHAHTHALTLVFFSPSLCVFLLSHSFACVVALWEEWHRAA